MLHLSLLKICEIADEVNQLNDRRDQWNADHPADPDRPHSFMRPGWDEVPLAGPGCDRLGDLLLALDHRERAELKALYWLGFDSRYDPLEFESFAGQLSTEYIDDDLIFKDRLGECVLRGLMRVREAKKAA